MGTPFVLDAPILATLRTGVAVVVGTAGEDLEPEICRAWGLWWDAEAGALEALLPLPAARSALENLARSGAVAFTFSSPTDYTAYQLKGVCVRDREPLAADWRRARRHFDAFLVEASRIGLEPAAFAPWFPARGRVVQASIDAAFIQTPGPGAGRRL